MPYEWSSSAEGEAQLTLRPHSSLTARGFVAFIAVTAALMALPLLAVLGSAVLWGVLPFLLAAIGAVWWALQRNWRDRAITETLLIGDERTELLRQDRTGLRRWQANSYWVQVVLYPTGGPVPNYLTLRGSDREVEIGAFLSEDERLALKPEIESRLAQGRGAPSVPGPQTPG